VTPTGYERALVRQVRNFARAAGCPAKTDALDAQMLVRYGTVFTIDRPVVPPVEKQADRETFASAQAVSGSARARAPSAG